MKEGPFGGGGVCSSFRIKSTRPAWLFKMGGEISLNGGDLGDFLERLRTQRNIIPTRRISARPPPTAPPMMDIFSAPRGDGLSSWLALAEVAAAACAVEVEGDVASGLAVGVNVGVVPGGALDWSESLVHDELSTEQVYPKGQQKLLPHVGNLAPRAVVFMGASGCNVGSCSDMSQVMGWILVHELSLGQQMTVVFPARGTQLLLVGQHNPSERPCDVQDALPLAAQVSRANSAGVGFEDTTPARSRSRR